MTASEIIALPTQASCHLIHATDNGKFYAIAAGQSGADAQVFVSEETFGTLLPKNNYAGTTTPAVIDDSSAGYAIGSMWIDTVAKEAYRCVDASVGAADWIESTLDATEVLALIAANAAGLSVATTAATIVAALGVPTYADLTAANAALAIGKIYFDTALSSLNVTTA